MSFFNLFKKSLSSAVKENNLEEVKKICSKTNADVNERDGDNRTPLMCAAARGNDSVLEYLLSVPGVQVNAVDEDGRTALHLAARNGHLKCVQLLSGCPGVNVNVKNKWERTPLMWAAARGKDRVLEYLLSVPGVQVNAVDEDGNTALHRAVARNNLKCVELLREREKKDAAEEEGRADKPSKSPQSLHPVQLPTVILADQATVSAELLREQQREDAVRDQGAGADMPSTSVQSLHPVQLPKEILADHPTETDESNTGGVAQPPINLNINLGATVHGNQNNTSVQIKNIIIHMPPVPSPAPVLRHQPRPSTPRAIPDLPHGDTHLFLTHDWGMELGQDNHARVSAVNDELKKRGYLTWFDNERLFGGDIVDDMTLGIDRTRVVLVFITRRYSQKVGGRNKKDFCKREFTYAVNRKGIEQIIPIVMEEEMKNISTWDGALLFEFGVPFIVDFTGDWEQNLGQFPILEKEIAKRLNVE